MGKTMYLNLKKIIITFIMIFTVFIGCKGSDTREAVDNTVEDFTGKTKVDQMKHMERNIGEIQDQQTDRLKMLEQSEDDE